MATITATDDIELLAVCEFQRVAAERARLVYGWGSEEATDPSTDRLTDARRASERDWLVHYYAWGIPCEEALEAIAEHEPIIEIGAGGGYWAMLLRQMGIDVIALDKEPGNAYAPKLWTEVGTGDEYSVQDYEDRALMLSWPPGDDLMAEWTLDAYRGDTVIYIGEHEGGCCATPGFFAMLERDFTQERVVDLPRFYGLHDYLSVWQR